MLHLVFKSCVEELEDSIPEPPLPPMRMDVLGLKHDEIMNKVCKHMLLILDFKLSPCSECCMLSSG